MQKNKSLNIGIISIPLGHASVDWFIAGFWILLPFIAEEFSLNEVQVASIITIRTLFSAIVYLPSGVLAGIISRRTLYASIAVYWVIVGYFLASYSPTYIVLIISVTCAEIGSILWHPFGLSSITKILTQRKGLATALFNAGGSIAEGGSPALMSYLIRENNAFSLPGLSTPTWRSVMRFNGIIVTLFGLIVLWTSFVLFKNTTIKTSKSPRLKESFQLLKLPIIQKALVIAIIRFLAYLSILTYLSIYLSENIGKESASLQVTLFLLAGVIGSTFLGSRSDKGNRSQILISSLAFGSIATALIPITNSLPIISVTVGLSGFFIGACTTVLVAMALDNVPDDIKAPFIGLFFAILEGFSSVALLATASIVSTWGTSSAFYFSGVLMALSIVVLIPRRGSKKSTSA